MKLRLIKSSLMICCLFVIFFLAAQCARGGATTEDTGDEAVIEANAPQAAIEVEPPEETYVEVFYGSVLNTDANLNPEQFIIEKFEAAHPGIRISRFNLEISADTIMTYLDRIPFTTVMVVWVDHDVEAAMEAGRLLDLSQLWADPDLANDYPQAFRVMGERDGKQYLMPAFYTWYGLYYKPDLFEAHNLRPPQTWDDFLAAAEALKQSGIAPIVYGGDRAELTTIWFDYLNMRLNGPEFHQALMRGEERYDDLRIEAVFESWAFLVENGYVADKAWSYGLNESRDMVVNGQAGMVLLNQADAPEELAFVRFPIIDAALPVGELVSTVGYIIPAESQYPLEAVEFVTFLASADSQTALTQQYGAVGGGIPVHQAVDPETITESMRQGMDVVQGADYIGKPFFRSAGRGLTVPLVSVFRNILLGREHQPDLERLERERQQLFEQ